MSAAPLGHGAPVRSRQRRRFAGLASGRRDRGIPLRVVHAVRASGGGTADVDAVLRWVGGLGDDIRADAEVVPLRSLDGWAFDPGDAALRHRSGRFFSVEGLRVCAPGAPVPEWDQPIIDQPEIGILGLAMREREGVLECLVQAKAEPGNGNGIQISPTVQATRSNFTGVHGGSAVPYLEHFAGTARRRVIADVLQSEQGSWFLHKRNRNMVVEVGGEVAAIDGFRWLPLGLLHQLLTVDDLVNMDARTVLSCLPFTSSGRSADFEDPDDDFVASVLRSSDEDLGSVHSTRDILSWITDVRTRSEVRTGRRPLAELSGWVLTDERIAHRTGCFFDVIGVDVRARGREIGRWSQPMFSARGTGLVALLVARVEGVLHALVQLRSEPGLENMPELAPTVQCTPASYDRLPALARPRFLDEVIGAPADRIVFDHVLSDEGGRFYRTRSRHLIVELPEADPEAEGDGFRWMAYHQLAALLHHSDYVNVQARSLVACLRSLVVPWAR